MAIQTITVDLGTAHTNKLYYCQGCQILVAFLSDDATATLRINHPSSDAINVTYVREIKTPKQFTKLYITNDAQTGKSLKLKIGLKTDIFGRRVLSEIDTIHTLESIESIPDPTPKGSEGIAFKQATAGAGAWQSPDGFSDPDSNWTNETKIYDDDTGTYAQETEASVYVWGSPVSLTWSTAKTSNKLRIWIGTTSSLIKIHVRINSVWVAVFEGSIDSGEYVEKEFTEGSVNGVMVRFKGETEPPDRNTIYEIDIWEVATTGGEMEVVQGTAADLKATVTQASAARTIQEPLSVDDNAGSLTVDQATAANLKATVTQASAARTVTGTVTAEQSTPASLKNQPHGEEAQPFAQFPSAPYYLEILPVGSQGAILQQKTTTYELLTDPVDRAARDLGTVDIAASLPAGNNAIGKLAANSGVDIGDVDVLSLPETGTVTHISATSTEDVKTCDAGHTLKVHGYFFYVSGDVTAELRFKISGNVIGGLTCEGAVGFNFVGKKCPTGADGEDIEIYLSGTGTVKGFIITEET